MKILLFHFFSYIGPCRGGAAGPNGNSIFLPAAGYRCEGELNELSSNGKYWSSSLFQWSTCSAFELLFRSRSTGWQSDYRYYGQSVRPVLGN